MSDDDDDDFEDAPLVEAEVDDDDAYEEWAAHPLGQFLTELVMAHIDARESDGIPFVGKAHPDSGTVEFYITDDAKRNRVDRWLTGEQVRGTGIRGRSVAVPKPTREQFTAMQSEAKVRRKRTSRRPALPSKRTSRPPQDRANKRGEED